MEYFVAVFDNDDDDKLGLLKDEENAVGDCIIKLGWKNVIRGNMGGRSLADLLGEIKNEMTVFHFSGHHGHGLLQMADGKVNTQPLISFLNGCPKLKLVFINGCGSQNFVSGLDQVPVVIGTYKSIIDSYAKEVAARFYKAIETYPDKFATPEGIESLFNDARDLENMTSTEDDMLANTVRGGDDDDDDDESGNVKDVYVFQLNRNARDFDLRVTLNINPEGKDVNKDFFELTQPLEEALNIGAGELYKTYPYLFAQYLEKLKPELERDGGWVNPKNLESLQENAKLSPGRWLKIIELHCQFVTFLKYCGFSILWTLHHKKKKTLQDLTAEEKNILINNLTYNYYGPEIGADKIEELKKMFAIIPADVIEDKPIWVRMKQLVIDEEEQLKKTADLFRTYGTQKNNVANWIKAEEYLIDFVTRDSFSFLRSLSIWSVYDIYYRQFRFQDDRKLVFTKGHFPIATRPEAGKSDLTEITLDPAEEIDYDIQSVYLMKGNQRILNLTPFYIDMNASDLTANKMEICYLEKYPKTQADVKLNFISLKDSKKIPIGGAEENEEQKKTFEQMKYFWSLISDNG